MRVADHFNKSTPPPPPIRRRWYTLPVHLIYYIITYPFKNALAYVLYDINMYLAVWHIIFVLPLLLLNDDIHTCIFLSRYHLCHFLQYSRQHCTLHLVFEQFRTLNVQKIGDKHLTRCSRFNVPPFQNTGLTLKLVSTNPPVRWI